MSAVPLNRQVYDKNPAGQITRHSFVPFYKCPSCQLEFVPPLTQDHYSSSLVGIRDQFEGSLTPCPDCGTISSYSGASKIEIEMNKPIGFARLKASDPTRFREIIEAGTASQKEFWQNGHWLDKENKRRRIKASIARRNAQRKTS